VNFGGGGAVAAVDIFRMMDMMQDGTQVFLTAGPGPTTVLAVTCGCVLLKRQTPAWAGYFG
jgi:hypothetical protein